LWTSHLDGFPNRAKDGAKCRAIDGEVERDAQLYAAGVSGKQIIAGVSGKQIIYVRHPRGFVRQD
jgi:hypothetical protein